MLSFNDGLGIEGNNILNVQQQSTKFTMLVW